MVHGRIECALHVGGTLYVGLRGRMPHMAALDVLLGCR